MSSAKARKESKFTKCMKSARDFYIRSLTGCAGKVSYGAYGGCPAPNQSALPRTFSSASTESSSNSDLKELMRAASSRSQQQARQSPMAAGVNVVPRSQTVAIGRIDEDEPCDFGEDLKLKPDFYPRSKSCAVTNRRDHS